MQKKQETSLDEQTSLVRKLFFEAANDFPDFSRICFFTGKSLGCQEGASDVTCDSVAGV